MRVISYCRAHKFKIASTLVLLLSVALAFYSIWTYPGDSRSGGTVGPGPGIHQGGLAPNGGNPGAGGPRRGGPLTGAPGRAGPPSGSSSFYPPGGSGDGSHRPARPQGANPLARSAGVPSPYATPLAVFATLFFGLVAWVFYRVARKKLQIQETHASRLIWLLLGIGLFLRVALAPWIPGHPTDIRLFTSWARAAASNLAGFYPHSNSDYPPMYVYVLYAVGKLATLPRLSAYLTLLIKLPSILADVTTAHLLYRVARKYASLGLGLLVAAFYTFNPAVFVNSTFWGQVDSFFTLLVVAAVLLLAEERLAWATVFLTAAVLMKPQGILYLPLLFFALLRAKRVRAWFTVAAAALATGLLAVLPFALGQQPLWLFKLYARTVNEYPYASVNAFNFYGLIGANYVRDTTALLGLSYKAWGLAFIVGVTAFSWWMYTRARRPQFASAVALLQVAGVFTFATSMHERYLFPAAALALLAYLHLQDNRLLWLALGFSVAIFVNTYTVLYHATSGAAPYGFALFAASLLTVLLCAFLAKALWDQNAQQTLSELSPPPKLTGAD